MEKKSASLAKEKGVSRNLLATSFSQPGFRLFID